MSNDFARHEVAEVLARVGDQVRGLSAVQRMRSMLVAKGTAADGAVVVTVDSQHQVTGVVIDETYLADYELADLGGHVTTAAQAAAREIDRKAAELMVSLTEGRDSLSAMSRALVDVPVFAEVLSGMDIGALPPAPAAESDPEVDEGDWSGTRFPTVRK